MSGFALWVGFGSALGLWRVARSAPARLAGAWVNIGLLVLLASLVGARLFYVAENWGYFQSNLVEALGVWLGGLSWPGAVLGAWLAMLYLAIVSRGSRRGGNTRVSLGWIGDRLYPILPPLAITAWLGSWQSGIGYGPALPAETWWSVPSLDQTGYYNPHWPLQPLAALSLLFYFAILEINIKPMRPAGRLSGLAMLGLLVNLLAASLLRADPAPHWNGLRLETWGAMALLAGFAGYWAINSLGTRLARKPTSLIP